MQYSVISHIIIKTFKINTCFHFHHSTKDEKSVKHVIGDQTDCAKHVDLQHVLLAL